jgi:DNA-directed RNA polymerase beta' subunit
MHPMVMEAGGKRMEDDITLMLHNIVKTNFRLRQLIDQNNPDRKEVIDSTKMALQWYHATYIDNSVTGMKPATQRSGRVYKAILNRVKGKGGRLRANLMGKRVNFSARTVITPDPNLLIHEIGVPLEIAMDQTTPERVTVFNQTRLQSMVDRGPNAYPGAKLVETSRGKISLKHKQVALSIGDVVHRNLVDGDIVLMNRQPTLHRMSMQGHSVVVLPGKTFRLNPSACRAYNADTTYTQGALRH